MIYKSLNAQPSRGVTEYRRTRERGYPVIANVLGFLDARIRAHDDIKIIPDTSARRRVSSNDNTPVSLNSRLRGNDNLGDTYLT